MGILFFFHNKVNPAHRALHWDMRFEGQLGNYHYRSSTNTTYYSHEALTQQLLNYGSLFKLLFKLYANKYGSFITYSFYVDGVRGFLAVYHYMGDCKI